MDKILFFIKQRKNIAAIWTAVYSAFLFVVFPLYYENSYVNILEAKTKLFLIGTAIYLTGCVVLILTNIWNQRNKTVFSPVDICCFCFLGAVLISTWQGENKTEMFWGINGRLFGTAIMLLCVCLYFCYSRFFVGKKFLLFCCLIGSSVVSILAIVNRLGFDPLQMYGAIDPNYIQFYMSTIGQINIVSAFLCMFLPLLTGVFLYSDKKWIRLCCGAGAALVLTAGVCTNSDSFFLSIGITTLFYIAVSFDCQETLTDCLFLFAVESFAMTILQKVNHIIPVTVWTHLPRLWMRFPWFAAALFFLALALLLRKKIRISRNILKRCKKIWLILWGILAVAVVLYIIVANVFRLSVDQVIADQFVLFDDHWGNNRGYVWKRTVESFARLPLIQQIFGVGPGQFPDFFATYYEDSIQKLGGYFADAHSEYLQYLVMTGLAGMLSYVGMIVCSVRACLKKHSAVGYVLAAVLLVWMAQGAVNNPVTFTEPYLFVFMGIAQRPWKA